MTCKITVFTATYNRLEKLKILYKSLQNQTDYNFEWVVIDDGSNDKTGQWIESIADDNRFPIVYVYQENQGKHMAFNEGIRVANGNMFLSVDSDDYLAYNAIESIARVTEEHKNCIGCITPKCQLSDRDREIWKHINEYQLDIIDLHEIFKIKETCIAIRSDLLKKYQFPQFLGLDGKLERFCPEGLLYNQLIPEGKFICKNLELYYYEYQDDGITRNVFSIWKENFHGVIAELRSRYIATSKYKGPQKIISHIKCIMNINALCIECQQSIIRNTASKSYSILLYLPSLIFREVRFKTHKVRS